MWDWVGGAARGSISIWLPHATWSDRGQGWRVAWMLGLVGVQVYHAPCYHLSASIFDSLPSLIFRAWGLEAWGSASI
jgi:hypothetical protein